MLLIGDVHGKWRSYAEIIQNAPASIQVGDMGIGLPHEDPDVRKTFEAATSQGDHRYIRGNHDNPFATATDARCILDGTVENGIMFLGGAQSNDRRWLIEGEDWWPEEELDIGALNRMIDIYDDTRPRVMVTHDAPEAVVRELFPSLGIEDSRTRQALDAMLEIHRPDLWVFGHYHKSRRQCLSGTEFICLAELETLEVDFHDAHPIDT